MDSHRNPGKLVAKLAESSLCCSEQEAKMPKHRPGKKSGPTLASSNHTVSGVMPRPPGHSLRCRAVPWQSPLRFHHGDFRQDFSTVINTVNINAHHLFKLMPSVSSVHSSSESLFTRRFQEGSFRSFHHKTVKMRRIPTYLPCACHGKRDVC